ncbi:hypothetical protein [Bacillus sp. V5-8f]|uniref:hypothetical protein n=1 Tax=Bacillus sp. V5-8f TaxID=2053044 RepID=UPI000C767AE6|nr:hypothetical protein [Bacillus sp. V5-8f]PLT33643.1 hypothetical protein CUU64_10965 [Bacillus sp. V5-8f]
MNVELKIQKNKPLSTEMLELQDEAKQHLANSKAENTKRAYRNDWTQFSEWCKTNGLQDLPAAPETLVYYITFLGKTLKASSIKRKMTAISQRHETAGYPSPTKTALVKGVWDGIQRKIGIKEEGKDALWLDDLRQVIQALPQNTLNGVRNRSLLVLGWAGALRRSELKAEHQIMKQTRHKRSDSLQRYIKKSNLFDDNAASGIGL